MAQGQFTKEEAARTKIAVSRLFEAIPKNKRADFITDLNNVSLFVDASWRKAPAEAAEAARAKAAADKKNAKLPKAYPAPVTTAVDGTAGNEEARTKADTAGEHNAQA